MATEMARLSPSTASAASNGASSKRKRAGDGIKYYAVREGRNPGVYSTWDACLAQVKGHKGALFQTFPSLGNAQAFVAGQNFTDSASNLDKNGEERFYAVQVGRVPGVYTDWPSASAQVAGVKRPRYRKFRTRAEAEAFVAEGRKGSAAMAVAVAQHADKKLKLANGAVAPGGLRLQYQPQTDATRNSHAEYPAGTAPLPLDAEDGFDPNIHLSSTGDLVYKSEQAKVQTKTIPKPRAVPAMLTIYTDGSTLHNGKACARAGVGVYFGPGDNKNVAEALSGTRQTNQRAELTAVLRALEVAPRNRHVNICSDSRYAIDCVTNWYRKWTLNGWLSANKKPVENRDLVQEIRARMEERQSLGTTVLFTWIKGHSGHAGNEAADRLALKGARLGQDLICGPPIATATAAPAAPPVPAAVAAAAAATSTIFPAETAAVLGEDAAAVANFKEEENHGGDDDDEEAEAVKAMERAIQEGNYDDEDE